MELLFHGMRKVLQIDNNGLCSQKGNLYVRAVGHSDSLSGHRPLKKSQLGKVFDLIYEEIKNFK